MICEKNKCYGCFACYNSCPKDAIEMVEDELGYIYPKINKEKCINCGICKKVCPSNTESKFNSSQKAYVAYSKDVNVNSNSASGGVAYEIYNHVINNGGVGYGVSSYISDNEISFIRIENEADIKKLQGSKYVHAYIKDSYKLVRKDLDEGKKVAFIGTPCQVDGLKCFLRKEYDNLICVDLICHGVPSQKFLKEEIPSNSKYVNFRGKEGFKIIAKDEKENCIYKNSKNTSRYYTAFLNALDYRENCYSCKYAQRKRVSDITIGDFWGLNDENFKNLHGNSVILVNTEKGEQFIKNINNLEIAEKELECAFSGNAQLNRPSERTKQVNKFKKIYVKSNFKNAVDANLKLKLYIGRIKELAKKILR